MVPIKTEAGDDLRFVFHVQDKRTAKLVKIEAKLAKLSDAFEGMRIDVDGREFGRLTVRRLGQPGPIDDTDWIELE